MSIAQSFPPSSPHLREVLSLDERRHARLGWWLVVAGFGGFLLWAALAPLDKGVPVSGSVVVAGSRQAVQHPGGGVVERLLVRDGDRVQAGQVLVQVDATQARAQRESLWAQYLGARAAQARLIAERDDVEGIDYPADLLAARDDPRVTATLELQRQLLASRRQSLRMELAGMVESIAGLQAVLHGLQSSRASKEQQRDALGEQLHGLRELARNGYIARNRQLESERLYAQLDGAISEDIGNSGRLQKQIAELKLRSAQRQEEYRKEVREQLAAEQTKAEDLVNRLKGAEFELANTQVRAPASGTVVGSRVFTEGGVIGPGEQLMEIVPEDAPLLVDAQVPVELIDKVHPGLDVELLFVAFNQSLTPRVEGKVMLVSADRLVDEKTGLPYYTLRVRVSEQGMRELAGLQIRPGMPVEAFVRTGERSLLNYLFKPLTDRVHIALAEE
ncbi:Type I secretion system membrane fusion protein PrsE [compost metagenome]